MQHIKTSQFQSDSGKQKPVSAVRTLLICSVHSLFDIAKLELKACNQAFMRNGMEIKWHEEDFARVAKTAPIPQVLNHMPGDDDFRGKLVKDYLDILNELIWSAAPQRYESLHTALAQARTNQIKRGFVSEYPMLTTNLARATALQTWATRLGQICAPRDPTVPLSTAEGLRILTTSLNVAPEHCEVLVANQRDHASATELGMHPRYVAEANLREVSTAKKKVQKFKRKSTILDLPAYAPLKETASGMLMIA